MTRGTAKGTPDRARWARAIEAPIRRRAGSYGIAGIVLAAAVALPLLANAVLLAGYAGSTSERATLSRQAQETKRAAEEALRAASAVPARIPVSTVNVPGDVESADIMDFFLRTAQESSVEVVGVNELGSSARSINGRDLRVFQYRLDLRARPSQLVAFLNRLEQAQQNALVISNLRSSPRDTQAWTVSVDILAFAGPATSAAR